ncbi:hypothetical protein ACIP2Y_38825 [Streptomyces sviceus]|uniref:hypothetical protein n=1 Tax=Streptomyces sviceus TaxID=285530 RepID=UPI0038260C60
MPLQHGSQLAAHASAGSMWGRSRGGNRMAAPDPVEPDDIYKAILETIFGPNSFILYIAVVGMAVHAWLTWAKSTHSGLRLLYVKASEIPAAVRLMSVAALFAVLAVQTLFLVLSYFLAAHLPRAIRETDSPADVDVRMWINPPESPLHETAFQVFFGLAVLFVVFSWWASSNPTARCSPVAAWMGIFGVMTVLVLFFSADGNSQMSLVALIYFLTALLALYAPGWCAKRVQSR